MSNLTVGVFGLGFVGETCYDVFSDIEGVDVRGFDVDESKTKNSFDEAVRSDVCFVCVPTPMRKNGRCYTKIVEGVVSQIRRVNPSNLIVIKSTVSIGTTEKLNKKFDNVIFNPEFLTEANAYWDFVECDHVIIGTEEYKNFAVDEKTKTDELVKLYEYGAEQAVFPNLAREKIYITDSKTAELTKYARNSYLATRITFFNQIYDICEKLNLSYSDLKNLVGKDKRIGNYYNRIDPESRHYGGTCLPKDLSELVGFCNSIGLPAIVLDAVQSENEILAGDKKDWEKLEGRAVIKKEED